MENEIRKQVKKETQKLSEFKPQVVSLDLRNAEVLEEQTLQEDVRNEFELLPQDKKESILEAGFRQFLENNELKTEKFIEDFKHKVVELNLFDKKKQEENLNGFVKICNSGDTRFELWVEDFEITKTTEAVIKFEDENEV